MRYVITFTLVLLLSTPAKASDWLRFVAHSLHQTNAKQMVHLADRARWWLDGPRHFIAQDPQEHVVEGYHVFWHQMLDAAPCIVGDEKSRLIYAAFIVAKGLFVVHNNRVEPNKYWLFHHTVHF